MSNITANISGGWFKLGEEIFKFLNLILDPSKTSARRMIKKIKYANKAQKAFLARQVLMSEHPRTKKTLDKMRAWDRNEATCWMKYRAV